MITIIYGYFIIGFLTSIFQMGRCVEAYYQDKTLENKRDIWLFPLVNLIIWPINTFL